MNIFHKDLSSRWNNFSVFEQMANIGTEVGRAISWRNKKNTEMSKNAVYRALELIDFSINDRKNKNSLKEIVRMREILADYFLGENIYQSTDKQWEKYFYPFNFACRKNA